MGEAHRRALGARAKRVADTWVPILTPIKHKKTRVSESPTQHISHPCFPQNRLYSSFPAYERVNT